MTHTIQKPRLVNFNHRVEGENITGVEGVDNWTSVEKVESLLSVLYARFDGRIEAGVLSDHNYRDLIDTMRSELLDIKSRISSKLTQKNQQLN